MIKYFKNAFKITNENIILATPLVLFLLLLGIYIGIIQNAPANLFAGMLLLITTFFMFAAFFAGWFFMIKKAIDLDKKDFLLEEEKAKASLALLKEITGGVGEYFLSFVGLVILYIGLFSIFSFITYKSGMHFVGKVNIDLDVVKSALNSTEGIKTMIHSIPAAELIKLNKWYFLFLGSMAIFSFSTMFWAAEIICKTKNAFIAFFKALSFTFKNFFSSLALFIYIAFVNFIVSILNAIGEIHPILSFISMIVYFYFIVYILVLVFLYYVEKNNPKTEDNSNSGTDSIGQDEPCNNPSFDE